jgi:hypothetical protein
MASASNRAPQVTNKSNTKPKASPSAPAVSRTRKPETLTSIEWQRLLRRQFGREQNYNFKNLGDEPIFSEFSVVNPTGGKYRVAIRGAAPGDNFCSCADFATNRLGTCKHVEFLLAALEKKRGGKAALASGFAPSFSEIYVHYGQRRSLRIRVGRDCPETLRKYFASVFEPVTGELPVAAIGVIEPMMKAAQHAEHELRCYDDALLMIATYRDHSHRRDALASAYPKGHHSAALKTLLKTKLYPYQLAGAWFLANTGRALLGDDMGLGKTVQALAATEMLVRHHHVRRVLVICPTSLKHQWREEITRFTTHEAVVVTGLMAARAQLYRAESSDAVKPEKANKPKVRYLIANYETISRDLDAIAAFAPDMVIVDEAQRIKNWNTIAARAVKKIASPHAIVLTGTPLENKLEELISIVQFVDQHQLGATWQVLENHQHRDENGRVVGYRELNKIGETLAPIMLRRRKSEVLLDLPERTEQTRLLPITPQQRAHHEEHKEIVAQIVQRWKRMGFLTDADQHRLTCSLQMMRMVCNSTYLLDHETDFGTKADELVTILDELFVEPANKVVIFSQWLRSHEIILRRLNARGWGAVSFHGRVASHKRGELIEQFKTDPNCRVFLSSDAGSVGLNLQHAASTVINMDLPWNPAVLEQRTGRVHRLGQKERVQTINLVAQGTIEEGILSLLAFKKSLFAGALDGGDNEVFLGGTRLAKFMAGVVQVSESMPPDSVAPDDAVVADAMAAAVAATATAVEPTLPPSPNASVATYEERFAETDGSNAQRPDRDAATVAQTASGSAWQSAIDIGLGLFKAVVDAANAPVQSPAESAGESPIAAPFSVSTRTNAATGQTFLNVALPPPEQLQRLLGGMAEMLATLAAKNKP